MSRTLAQLLLLALTLLVLAVVAHRMAGLSLPAAVALLVAGGLAQAFASYRPPSPDFVEPRRGLGLGRAIAWVLRAAIGIAVLCAALQAALWLLPSGA